MDRVREEVGQEAFTTWLAPLHPEDYDPASATLVLVAPSEFYIRWIERRYITAIHTAFAEAFGAPVHITFSSEENFERLRQAAPEAAPARHNGHLAAGNQAAGGNEVHASRRASDLFDTATVTPPEPTPMLRANEPVVQPLAATTPFPAARISTRRGTEPAPLPRLNPRYLFDEFVVGESNRYAHAAATAVADPRSKAFNPLFIYGGSGLGKTHLMQAIGHRMYELDRRLNVLYVTSESFINGFIDAIQNKRHVEFRDYYRNVDLLLIDDVQFLMGKERTQQEFFHTFNALYDAGKKVVVTSDRPPRELSTLEDRLRSRFEWGLLVDIQSPDLETRIAILKKKAQAEGVQLPSDVVLFVAEHITENIREMEGALKRLRMTSSLHGRAIDLENAREVLGHLLVGTPQPRVTVEDIQRAVCSYFNIQVKDLLGKNRAKKFSSPRHVAQYLCRRLTDFSFPDIAQKFGGKDHTSVIYACRKVETAAKKEPGMAQTIDFLIRQITRGTDDKQRN